MISLKIAGVIPRWGGHAIFVRSVPQREEFYLYSLSIDDTEGLPTGEQNPEDGTDVHDSLPPEELEGINRVAEELRMTFEQGIAAMPVNLVPPDEPEPPLPSVNVHEHKGV
jgi:hypothetical protein